MSKNKCKWYKVTENDPTHFKNWFVTQVPILSGKMKVV